jgi:hypothetical protein
VPALRFILLSLAVAALSTAHVDAAAKNAGEGKVCGVYTNVLAFASRPALDALVVAQPPVLLEKQKEMIAGTDPLAGGKLASACGFDTVFMTIYPLWGKDWWNIPAAKAVVYSAVANAHEHFHVHLGLSLFNKNFCDEISRYPGALRTKQCDGTRPNWVCFFDDALWNVYEKNLVEMAKVPGVDGVFIDPEAYGSECYLCFCDNCVRKFNGYAHEQMPTGLVKPDAWLNAHGLWKKYTVDWHGAEVRRHASAVRDAIHAVNPKLQLASLLWDYPVAVNIGDARQGYFRSLAIGLGTKELPAWTMPEHTYYSDANDLSRIVGEMEKQIRQCGAEGSVKVLPGVRLLRQTADSMIDRGKALANSDVPGYWMYELADLQGKPAIDFEGRLIEPGENYVKALRETNEMLRDVK